MLGPFEAVNNTDPNGNPTGGFAVGIGIRVDWQDGPLGREGDRREPNGAFAETLIAIAIQRIEFYQQSPFACRENALAITKLEESLHWLNHRTKNREQRGVEGLHQK